MLEGAKFGDRHTLNYWGLYLKKGSPSIGEAEPQTLFVDVPGRDGSLDLSAAIDGQIHYNDRTITVELVCTRPREEWAAIDEDLKAYLHGHRMNVTFDNDPEWYWTGRWSVGALKRNTNGTATIKITGTCSPYKISQSGRWKKL
jgi:hypothetical protein